MKYDPLQHHRRSVRLAGYDYATPGAYFVTIVTGQRRLFFEEPGLRQIAEACWRQIPAHAPSVSLDEWVVMPNHVHGIIVIDDGEGRRVQLRSVPLGLNAPTDDMSSNARTAGVAMNAPTDGKPRDPDNPFSVMSPRRHTLAVIVRTYKAAVTTAGRRAQLDFGWQRGYYERVLRGAADLDRSRAYIQSNPARWAGDQLNPAAW